MPRIKLVKIYSTSDHYGDDISVLEPMTEWEEVTNEELELLQDYRFRHKLSQNLGNGNMCYTKIIVAQEVEQEEVKDVIKSAKDLIAKTLKKQKEEQKKRAEAKKKAEETRKAKAIEKAKRLLKESGEI